MSISSATEICEKSQALEEDNHGQAPWAQISPYACPALEPGDLR